MNQNASSWPVGFYFKIVNPSKKHEVISGLVGKCIEYEVGKINPKLRIALTTRRVCFDARCDYEELEESV
jgi:hypothetical protein